MIIESNRRKEGLTMKKCKNCNGLGYIWKWIWYDWSIKEQCKFCFGKGVK